MSIRRIELGGDTIAAVVLFGDVADPGDDNIDVHAHLRDGRVIAFTAFTLRNVNRLMRTDGTAWFVCPGMVLVDRLTDDAIVSAVRDAVSMGVGVLQQLD